MCRSQPTARLANRVCHAAHFARARVCVCVCVCVCVVLCDSQLDHPNIVRMIGVVKNDTLPMFVVLAFCSNGSLVNYLRNNGKQLTAAMQSHVCAEILGALVYLASRRILHCDIAARNILLTNTLSCKLSDFGLGIFLGGQSGDSSASPNQSYHSKATFNASDHWSRFATEHLALKQGKSRTRPKRGNSFFTGKLLQDDSNDHVIEHMLVNTTAQCMPPYLHKTFPRQVPIREWFSRTV